MLKYSDNILGETVLKSKAPLIEAIENYGKAQVYPLHTPGHKGGRGAAESLQQLLGKTALTCDVSLMEELDDIHEPTTYIKEAQNLAAELYGAEETFFAPNGTTGAIHGMLLGALNPHDKVLVPRNAHRSVFGGLVLAGLVPVYVMPAYNKEWNLALQITAEQVEQALQQEPEIKGVLLTSPNYYGLAADVEKIAQVAHKYNAVLLVDEAHGPHLGFSPALPASALQQGADAVAQSTHKILGALTQCSMLHIKSKYIKQEQMAAAMSLVTTTSPNNLLLASLDAAREQMASSGRTMVEAAIHASNILREHLQNISGVRVLAQELIGLGGVVALDTTKVTINVTGLGLTGVEAGQALRQAGIAVELVDATNVLFLVTYADNHPQWQDVVHKICQTLEEARKQAPLSTTTELWLELPEKVLSPREAFFATKETIPWEAAAEQISGEQISFYPPGIPLLLPGEIITKKLQAYCQRMLALGLHLSGPKNHTLETIQVIRK